MNQTKEQSVVIIKPDGVRRALMGKIITRLERAGLKIVACKMVTVDADFVGRHYRDNKDYHRSVGEKTLENYEKYCLNATDHLGTDDPIEIGRIVRKWNMEFLSSGPVLAMIFEGPHAIEMVRKIVGHTFPQKAEPGTIRGDYTVDSPLISNLRKSSVRNLIHASGDEEEAAHEVKLWFSQEEIQSYKRVDEALLFEGK